MHLKHKWVLIGLVIVLLALSITSVVAQDEIRIARANWDTGYFQAAVFTELLTRLGYQVDEIGDMPPTLFYPALADGTDVDLWVNGWVPLHDAFLTDEFVYGNVVPVGYEVENGALQGYLVDKATAEANGIESIMDLTDPEIAALFDRDGNGNADLIGCNAGWGCEAVINDTIAALELEDDLDHVQGEYALLMADTIARFGRGEPVLYYTWTPNWTVAQLAPGEDVVWLSVPETEDVPAVEGIAGCATDPCAMGFVPNSIRAVGNVEFLREHPDVAALLSVVEIPLEDIAAQNQLMTDGEDRDDDIARHASEWLEANAELVDEWIAFAEENADNTDIVETALAEFMEAYPIE